MKENVRVIPLVGGPADGQTYAVALPQPPYLETEPFPTAGIMPAGPQVRYLLQSFFFFYEETLAYVVEGMDLDAAADILFKRLRAPQTDRPPYPSMSPTVRPTR